MTENSGIVAMTETQFTKFIDKISRAQEDHDLLIEIKTILMSEKEGSIRQRSLCHEKFGTQGQTLTKAHERIDKLNHVTMPILVTIMLALLAVVEYFK